uniref:Spore protein YkvP/CgeB glycosyl transferase-like domain-containing protein n=1 Tax=viral metagenome TaxID=1070528 RepID=A0A6C0EJD7_9ZZZZ
MKIIIIQAAGAHDGTTHLCKNDYLRECLSLKYAFEQNGWIADIWGKRHENFDNPPDFNSYDYLLNLENYEMEWLPDFTKITKPIKMQWIIDLHCQSPMVYARTSCYMDIILHATKSLIDGYKQHIPNIPHIWFPPAIDERYFKNYNLEKNENIVFVGNVINRGGYINRLTDDVNLKYCMKTGKEMLDIISKSKIHFNKSMSPHGCNYRNLETIGLGTCLLADYKPEICEMGFKNGVNCLLYKDYNDCLKKYNYAMTKNRFNKYNYETIAEEGMKLALQHTYTKRVETLINDITNLNTLR